jgi:hypothetical protein
MSELRAHLKSTVTLTFRMEAIPRAPRRYTKRQLNRFREERLAHWIPGFGRDVAIAAPAERLADVHLRFRTAP